MCGIAGFYLKEPDFVKTKEDKQKMERFLNQLLLGIEPRGHDATGFMAIANDGKRMLVDKRAVTATEFIRDRKALPDKTQIVLGHTRYVTKGSSENWFNNHPVGWKSVFITHNGTISNDDKLFTEKKWTRHAQVDSEVIAALIANEGWDDVDELNKTLRGGYAVAAADLEKPGEVLLFKGGTWPIAYHDNKNFIVWASEAIGIQKAWGNVLGTPPTLRSFEHLADGEAVRIKDGEVSFHEAPKSTTYSSSSRPNWESSYGEDEDWLQYGTCESPWALERNNDKNRSAGRTQSTVAESLSTGAKLSKNNSVQIALMRADGLGKATTWLNRKAGKLTPEQKAGFSGKWDWCSSCSMTVSSNDMFSTLAWGRICIDCHSFLSNPVNKGTEPEPGDGTAFNELAIIDNLEDWVALESKIYYSALLTVSDNTGLQTATVDYLLQRISPKELIANPKLRQIKDEVHAEFEDAENTAWEQYSEDCCSPGPRGKCASYNQIDAKCPGCDFCIVDIDDEPEKEEREIGVQPFAEEGLWVTCAVGTHKTSDKCEACDTPKAEKKEKAPKKPNSQCMTLKCRKKAKVHLVTSKGKMRWCYKHYAKCSSLGCQDESKGCDKDGNRLCHEHFRGVKGGQQDTIRKQHESATV